MELDRSICKLKVSFVYYSLESFAPKIVTTRVFIENRIFLASYNIIVNQHNICYFLIPPKMNKFLG